MTKSYVNLHTHGVFSLLDGYGKYEDYAAKVKKDNCGAIGVTEHGNIHGWIPFYNACKEYGVKPILGIEAYQARKSRFDRDEEERAGKARHEWDQRGPYHLTIHAVNDVGYKNLIKMSSRSYQEGFFVKPRIDYELLADHSEGLIVASGCLGGAVQQALLRNDFDAALNHAATAQEIVGKENYFIEIQDHNIEEQRRVKAETLKIAKIIGAKVIATCDCHYVHEHDHHGHDLMICTGTKAQLSDENRFKFEGAEFYLKSYEEMAERFDEEWLKNTCEIGDRVDFDLKFGDLHFPEYPDIPEDKNPTEYLRELTWSGLKDRYGTNELPAEVVARTEHELGVIERMGFTQYFLVVGDLVNWAKANGVRVGAGRGSAAGCMVSYGVGITGIDPIKYGLMFERFLVEGRVAPPDIDLDFDDRYRDLVVNYAREKYGDDHICHIVTFSQEGARSAIRDATRVLGHEYGAGDAIAKLMPPPVLGVSKSIKESMEEVEELRVLYDKDPVSKEILDSGILLEGVYRQTGIHAAGVVIAPGPVTDYIPVMQKGENSPVVSQWSMEEVEENGLLKIDFLGLRNLAIVDMAISNIERTTGEKVDIDNIPIDDSDVYEYLSEGNTVGVFQLESDGITQMTKDLRPESLEDIMALIALYRPGPLGSGMDKMYIDRKHGREKITYVHSSLEDVLEKSRGIMLYQEDVIAVCRKLAGFSVMEADEVRRVIGKKKMDKVAEYRDKFVEGAKRVSGVSDAVANKIYSDIEYFAGYGFNLAHSCSYAMLAYATAYLKYHWPKEYMAATLTSVSRNKDRLALYLAECKRLGIEVLPPSMNESDSEFTPSSEENAIRYGFSCIDGIGDKVIEKILDARPKDGWENIYDFFRYSSEDLLNQGTFRKLVWAGAMDELLFDNYSSSFGKKERLETLSLEREHLGAYITGHPLDTVQHVFEGRVTHSSVQIPTLPNKEPIKIGGLIAGVTQRMTKTGQRMYIISLEDAEGSMEAILYVRNNSSAIDTSKLKAGNIGVFKGWVRHEVWNGTKRQRVIMRDFEPIDPDQLYGGLPIYYELQTMPTNEFVISIADIIRRNPGPSSVFISYKQDGKTFRFEFDDKADYGVKSTLDNMIALGDVDA